MSFIFYIIFYITSSCFNLLCTCISKPYLDIIDAAEIFICIRIKLLCTIYCHKCFCIIISCKTVVIYHNTYIYFSASCRTLSDIITCIIRRVYKSHNLIFIEFQRIRYILFISGAKSNCITNINFSVIKIRIPNHTFSVTLREPALFKTQPVNIIFIVICTIFFRNTHHPHCYLCIADCSKHISLMCCKDAFYAISFTNCLNIIIRKTGIRKKS